MTLIGWVTINVTSIVLPFDLSSGFSRWAYALPAHEIYQILVDIWSRSCNPQLRYALCILFAYEISGLILSGLGVHRRCHYAVIAQENEKAAFQSHLDAALAFGRKRDLVLLLIPSAVRLVSRLCRAPRNRKTRQIKRKTGMHLLTPSDEKTRSCRCSA